MRKSMRSSKKTKMGKIKLPMDIRDKSQIPAFEDMLENGPMMIVLVYADWCGHCTKYKDNVWNPLKSIKDRKMNMASIHYDQLENTSLKNSKIEGYPSLLVAGPDKTPATFKNADGTSTNALPKSNDFTTMKNLVTSPVISDDEKEEEEFNGTTLPNISKEASNISNSLNSAIVKKPMNSSINTSTSKELPPITSLNSKNTNSASKNINSASKNINSVSKNINSVSKNTESVSEPTNSLSTPMDTTSTPMDTTSTTMDTTSTPMDSASTTMDSASTANSSDTLETGDVSTPPTISEDVVSLTNSTTLPNSSAPPPVAMMGGRLYRMLSYKKKRSKRKGTRKQK
jgi:uncharacterized protein YoxC